MRRHGLIEPGGGVTCLVSGGPDSTCLWHALGALGYRVSALHVNHGLRGAESEATRASAPSGWAPKWSTDPGRASPRRSFGLALRGARRGQRCGRPGHTASDQVETILYRLVSSGRPSGIRVRRDDGVVRPLLGVWREETEAYCRAEGLEFRSGRVEPGHEARPDPGRDPAAAPPAASGRGPKPPRRPSRSRPVSPGRWSGRSPSCSAPGTARSGSTSAEGGRPSVSTRRSGSSARRRGSPGPSGGGGGCSSRAWPGSSCAGGDRATGWLCAGVKVQDLFVRAKIPRSERDAWPLVVKGGDVVLVPGVASAPGYEEAVVVTEGADDEERVS